MSLIADNTIEDIVRANVSFSHGAARNGWNRVYCAVCGDGSRTKGPRGGWLFQDEMCFYHCFNCGVDGNFDPNRDIAYSKDMSKIFNSFNIPRDQISSIVFKKKVAKTGPAAKPKREKIAIKPIEIPNHFYKLNEADTDDLIAIKAREYLQNRHIDPSSYPFYLSTGVSHTDDPADISLAKSLRNRLIIPSMRNNKMVYYIARSLDPNSKLKYLNASVPKTNIIYGFDKLYTNIKIPLFVQEGFFDAYHLDGVAVLQNKMTKDQIDILEKSPRMKVVVPDRHGDSKKLAEQALDLGWGLAIPDIGACKDTNEAIIKYGKLYVIDSIMKNIKTGRAAEMHLKFF